MLWSGKVGGAERFTIDLARQLRLCGLDVAVLFITTVGPAREPIEKADLDYLELGFRRGRQAMLHPRRLARVAIGLGPDGAFLTARGFIAAAMRLGGYRGPIIATEHGSAMQAQNARPYERLKRKLDWYIGDRATSSVVAVSDAALARLAPRRGMTPVRIHNGVDLDAYDPTPAVGERPLVVGCAARLIRGKGIDVLLRAAAPLLRRGDILLNIAGDGPERDGLQQLAVALGIAELVAFSGWWIGPMSEFWRRCDIAVVPSDDWIESFGLAALEAMAMARPVIATRGGGLVEVVRDGTTGVLVPPGDATGLANALEAYVRQPALARVHGSAGRRRVEESFGLSRAADRYLAVWRKARAST